MIIEQENSSNMYISPLPNYQHKYPYSIVWTTIPGLSWFLPSVGHVGICKSDGTIYDFLGKGDIHKGQLGFGDPKKYTCLYYEGMNPVVWDNAVEQASLEFSRTDHSLISNNCHHHVARVLNLANYKGRNNWSGYDIFGLSSAGIPIH